MQDNSMGNKSIIVVYPECENFIHYDSMEQEKDWFSIFLELQAMSAAFIEYLLMEDQNGRR
jgi:hypothetical protein